MNWDMVLIIFIVGSAAVFLVRYPLSGKNCCSSCSKDRFSDIPDNKLKQTCMKCAEITVVDSSRR